MLMAGGQPASAEEGVPGSRCFVVCGKAITNEDLHAAFSPYGNVQSIKIVREKGVAYVKYDKASTAALAIENLNGAVLNNGRGPKLKVLLAEAPSTRGFGHMKPQVPEVELSSDPDNVPPRSRLFIVVPKQADPQQIQDEMSRFQDLEYCKTDLAASKGVVFSKFSKSSSALAALETIGDRGTLAGYKVKVMLAEPKTKRGRGDGQQGDMLYNMQQVGAGQQEQHQQQLSSAIGPTLNHPGRLDYPFGMDHLKQLQMNSGLPGSGHMGMNLGMHDYSGIGGLSGLGSNIGFNTLAANMNNMAGMNNLANDMQLGSQGLGFMGGLGGPNASAVSPVSPNNMAAGLPLSKQRLFVVVHKAVTEEAISRLFRRFPGMEYCDLKKERATGKSKGYCYVNYSTPDAAGAAVEQLNGIEFPPHSGHRIKVMFAEPMGVRSGGNASANTSASGASVALQSTSTSGAGGGASSFHTGGSSGLPTRSPAGVLSMNVSSPSPSSHTPLSRSTGMGTVSGVGPITPDTMASVSDSLAGMSLHHAIAAAAALPQGSGLVGSSTSAEVDTLDRAASALHNHTAAAAAAAAAHLASPVGPADILPAASAVARELMFNVN